jgi:hypothetical protein
MPAGIGFYTKDHVNCRLFQSNVVQEVRERKEIYMYFVTLYAQVLLTLGIMAGVNEADGALIMQE